MKTIPRRFLKIAGMLFIAVFPILCLQIKFIIFSDRVRLDGKKGELFGILFWPSTVYSKEYSHSKFLSIIPGMTADEVLKRLGEPMDIIDPYSLVKDSAINKVFRYSAGVNSNSHYRLRVIYLRNGIVVKRMSEFHYME